MLREHATLQQIRLHLQKELTEHYPEGESASMIRLILEHTGFPPGELLMEPDKVPGPATRAQINEIVSEIHTGKPLQYILGYTLFCDLKIIVNENVLIPRPETEEMVYRIIERIPFQPGNILDVGTGSGCIALAMKQQYPTAKVTGLDISRSALELATQNARIHHLELSWLEGDIMDDNCLDSSLEFDLIISNPPYVLNSEKTAMHSNVLDFEPGSALFVDDQHPLIFYDAIARLCGWLLRKKGFLWFEINERFGKEISRRLQKAGFQHVNILKDIHEKERFIEASREKP
jgi:release factor glutamine methyltransferase